MKYFLTIFAVVLFHFSGSAQNKSKDEMDVANRVETLRQAMIDADGAKLKELTSAGLSYGHSNGNVQNQAVFVEKITNGESDFVTIEFQNQTIEIVGDNAIVRHNLVAHTKDGGIDKDIKIGIMLVWQKQKNKWLLIARQAYKLPTT
ncbi:nuclear transport factor 2 family protein [Flavobacterium franklandianum]|uniref:Nuclear transport factor 2 family protein n=2 Tax=Flavobacterium TaxID=237 RepID=A0A3S0UVA7_9FLAO|nr:MULTISPECIES: nuclear transport factor 2 family protein [Flavobacterium]RTY97725.1 nuclear transport factor 2 family protein [Flavobacterium bomense]TRX22742.1 nuclear transport factor 2 family protein [Flavobacterium franklandianum]TRX26554.1 nuclear transport factor 2 family protein [Flavobacterium franklandianum]